MVELVFENQTEHGEWNEKFFKPIVAKTLERIGLETKQVELGIQIVSPGRIQELNLQHRQKDKPTDVLSFPINDHVLDEYGILPLGDIFICPDVAIAQAQEHTIPITEEMARLAIHGILHLAGYDHETSPADHEKMINLQEEILNELTFRHG